MTKQYKDKIFEVTNLFPAKITTAKRIKAISQNDLCICQNCRKIHGNINSAGFCNQKCYLEYKSKNIITDIERKNTLTLKSIEKYKNLTEGYDYIICKECGFYGAELTSHISTHNLTPEKYKQKYNIDYVKCQKLIDCISGKNNPGYQHGGKFSPFSDKFLYADTIDKKELIIRTEKSRKDNNSHTTSLSYWLRKTDGNLEEAEKLLSKRQTTFSLDICIEKYGEELGKEIWLERQKKWLDNLNSKSEEEIESINKNKSNSMSYSNLWTNRSIFDGKFYLLELKDNFYKIGITSRSICKRYSKNDNYKILIEFDSTINHCFQIEQLLKQHFFKNNIISKSETIGGFGWTETLKDIDVIQLLNIINTLSSDKEHTTKLFKENFKLNYAENF